MVVKPKKFKQESELDQRIERVIKSCVTCHQLVAAEAFYERGIKLLGWGDYYHCTDEHWMRMKDFAQMLADKKRELGDPSLCL